CSSRGAGGSGGAQRGSKSIRLIDVGATQSEVCSLAFSVPMRKIPDDESPYEIGNTSEMVTSSSSPCDVCLSSALLGCTRELFEPLWEQRDAALPHRLTVGLPSLQLIIERQPFSGLHVSWWSQEQATKEAQSEG
ncbi:hypothetical protein KUDE01_031150, partial [Dissostichus eleginoides]